MNPILDREIECERHRKDLHVRVINVPEDRAMLTHIVASHTFSETARDARRIAKEVWNELGNVTGEWWPEENISIITQAIRDCFGFKDE